MELTQDRILVTGGAGFVGANLVRELLREGSRVRVLDNLNSGSRRHLEGLDVDLRVGDIRDPRVVAECVHDVDAVVHLAAQTGVPGSLADPRLDAEINIEGTLNLLEACRHQAVSRFVFASSNAPLGRQRAPATEDKAALPISPYGASKLAGEGYCLAYHGSWQLDTVILRFANLYGPFSGHKNSVVAHFCKQMLDGRDLVIDGDGLQTRDFIYVGDLCRAVILAVRGEVSGEVLQIATGVETSVLELAGILTSVTGVESRIRHAEPRRGDIRYNYSVIDKARRLLGWAPTTDLETGLRETWRWFSAEF